MSRIPLALAFVAAVALASCSGSKDSPTGPGNPAPTQLTMSETAFALEHLGATRQITLLDESGQPVAASAVEWTSSSDLVATVSPGGLVQAIANGSAEIVASVGSLADTATVNIEQKPSVLVPTATTFTLDGIGDTLRVAIEVRDAGGHLVQDPPLSWSTSAEDVAEVTEDGLITSVGPGVATVTATALNVTVDITVTVSNLVSWRIIFASWGENYPDIHIMDADGQNMTNLTHSADSFDTYPRAHPHGTAIAFTSDRSGNREIYVINPDGSDLNNLTKSGGDDFFASWSPDGEQLVWTREETIHVMNADGSNQKSLGQSGLYPSWSPDGLKIAFIRSNQIHVMSSDGSDAVNIGRTGWQELAPVWSPDGSLIAFTGRSGASGGHDLYTMTATGTDHVNRSNTAGWGESFPAWRPDGAKILYAYNATNDSEIWVRDADGKNPMRLTFRPGSDGYPAWIGGLPPR